MKSLFATLFACTIGIVATAALGDDTSLINEMNMKPLTPAQSAQLKAERDAAKAKWAAMSQSQKDAVTQSMRKKKLGELDATERFGQNDDMMTMTKSETAQAKAAREAAQAKYATMTPDQKAAIRKSAQQKRLSDLDAMEQAGQRDDMGRYMSY
jgi:hypothetical protein